MMDLGKVKVEPKDIVPDIKFYGETNFDTEQLKNVEDVKEIAFEAIARLWDVATDTLLGTRTRKYTQLEDKNANFK